MVRFSDIFKKKIQPVSSSSAPVISQKELVPEVAKEKPPGMQIAKVMKETQTDVERSKTLYSKGIQLAKEILDNARDKKPIDLTNIKDLVTSMVDSIVLGDKGLLNLFYEYTPENYLYSHMVNVLIMSVEVGLGLGYNKSKLNELGLASFLHDVGMIKVEKITSQPRGLSDEEYSQIREHPLYGAEVLSKIKDIPEAVIYVVKEEHERMNGQGYPQGIKDGQISEYARIIGTVDVYEALTHNRAYRKKYPPHGAIKEILTAHSALFDPAILRVLISQVGIYPIGSWVELNTNEIGKVVATNDELPLRPVVSLIFDSASRRLEEPRPVNLVNQFNLFVKRPLTDEEVLKKTKEVR